MKYILDILEETIGKELLEKTVATIYIVEKVFRHENGKIEVIQTLYRGVDKEEADRIFEKENQELAEEKDKLCGECVYDKTEGHRKCHLKCDLDSWSISLKQQSVALKDLVIMGAIHMGI